MKREQPSPYLCFNRETWRQFRQDTPLTLSEAELIQLKGQNQPVSLLEVEEIYLPLSRLLNLYIAATKKLYSVTHQFLGHVEPAVPYVIGIAGSVAVGKSTTSRILKALLARWPDHPEVVLITTDSFLYPTAVLEARHLMAKKGFPESYDTTAIVQFLSALKAGKSNLKIPVYSHHYYDIVPHKFLTVNKPDIVIIEGLNVLQLPSLANIKPLQWFVPDFFDFTIYVDAPTTIIQQWFLARFMSFRQQALHDSKAFFYRFSHWSEEAALAFACNIWADINERNLIENILPFKQRARLILEKDKNHLMHRVFLRKL